MRSQREVLRICWFCTINTRASKSDSRGLGHITRGGGEARLHLQPCRKGLTVQGISDPGSFNRKGGSRCPRLHGEKIRTLETWESGTREIFFLE